MKKPCVVLRLRFIVLQSACQSVRSGAVGDNFVLAEQICTLFANAKGENLIVQSLKNV